MSVLIKGMEMPKNCYDCQFEYDCILCRATGNSFIYRSAEDGGYVDFCETRMPDCPLVEVPIDYDELLKAAKAMHTWIFLHSSDEEMAYKACRLSDEMNTLLGYSGAFTVITADKDGET